MIQLHRIAFLAAFVTLAAGFAAPVAVAGPVGVPFLATLTTTEKIAFDPASCQTTPFLEGTTTGDGQATHLGAVTGSATDCITPTSAYSYAFTNGKLSLIAANGDELRAEYQGNLLPTLVTPIFTAVGTYRITGGTGRFNGASGFGAVLGLVNLKTGQGQLTLKGTISY